MLRLGLTGGIASGKSTVGSMLRKLGLTVLDADSIAHELIETGEPAYEEVVREFGPAILNADKRISRAALAKIVFADAAKLARLNAIVHPRVEERLLEEFEKLQRHASAGPAFVEAALIIEAGLDKKLDGVVVVWCKPEQQLARLLERGLSEEEARRRITSQLSLEEKLRHATEKIDCSGSLARTRQQVKELATKLRAVPNSVS
ncbi:MAG: dephospho-CoA kinase [Candidatus Acidiferrum sp.]